MAITTTIDGIQIEWVKLEAEMKRVMRLWRRNAQAKLRREDKNSTGTLTRSMKTIITQENGQLIADITPRVNYWQFVDGGVRGARTSPYARQGENPSGGTPFRFKDKKPPLNVIKDWMKQRGIKNRDSKGRFKQGDGLAYAIQNAIFSRGIKPTFFLSDTGKRIEAKYANSIATAYAEDFGEAIAKHIDDNQAE